MEPIQQIKALPMKMTVQTYLNHVSEEEFERSLVELKESRRQYQEARQTGQQQPPVVESAVIIDVDQSASHGSVHREQPYPQQNLQREIVTTTVATAPIVLNNVVFEEGVIDTGATNTMVSQSAVRRLGMIDRIEPSKIKFSCADGKMSAPWGIIRKLPVGVEGFTIPIDVFVSGATSYDVLLGTDWLIQAHAEISFAKSEMTYRIDPQFMGRVPITVLPGGKNRSQYCDFHTSEDQPGDPGDQPELTAEETIDPEETDEYPDEIASSMESFEEESEASITYDSEYHTEDDSDEDKENLMPIICNAALDEPTTTSALGDLWDIPQLETSLEHTGEPLIEIRHTTEDWMLERNIFKTLEEQWGPFDVDACCDEEGSNSQLPAFWSPAQDCLQQDWTHKSVYCNPPFSKLHDILEHSLACYKASPFTTSAIFVIPWWPTASWFTPAIEELQIVMTFPAGTQLFTAPS